MFAYLRTFAFSFLNSLCKIFLEVFIFDRQIRRILKGKLAKSYLKKYVKKAYKAKLPVFTNAAGEAQNETTIWQYWEQGVENMPDIAKACVNSVEKHKNGCKHIILDKESVKEYVKIPDIIWKLNKKGVIKSAHLSDVVRTYLLCEYGGVWIDATVLLTDDLPEFITSAELFVFQNDLRIDLDGLNMASYFIAAKPHNEILERTRLILENYWAENRFLNNYFMFLHAFTMVTQFDSNSKEKYGKIPFFSFIPVQMFQKELLKPYNTERFEQIKRISFAHKLSYKTHVLSKHAPMVIKDTFYEKLVEGEI
ncbi:MAG: glycosyltransferase [Candidatus Gastranaerophilales bacterium]|nr:glycosyltransferase [Candidatus Gastranaerophilales bacterium]